MMAEEHKAKKKGKRKAEAATEPKAEEPEAEAKKAPADVKEEGAASQVKKGRPKDKARAKGEAAAQTEKAPSKRTEKKKLRSKVHRLEEAQAQADASGEEESEEEEEEKTPRGIIYLGGCPTGFEELQQKLYFEQFGVVKRLKVVRSKKTAGPRGYGWVEFEEEAVAKIVANTMDGYLMWGKKLVCHFVKKDSLQKNVFKHWRRRPSDQREKRRKDMRKNYNFRPRVKVNGEVIPQTTERQVKRRGYADIKLKAILKKLDVEYTIPEPGEGAEERVPEKKSADVVAEEVADVAVKVPKAAEEAGTAETGAARKKRKKA